MCHIHSAINQVCKNPVKSKCKLTVSFNTVVDLHLFSDKISTKVFFTIAGLAGLFVCFFGHRFFKCGEKSDDLHVIVIILISL